MKLICWSYQAAEGGVMVAHVFPVDKVLPGNEATVDRLHIRFQGTHHVAQQDVQRPHIYGSCNATQAHHIIANSLNFCKLSIIRIKGISNLYYNILIF